MQTAIVFLLFTLGATTAQEPEPAAIILRPPAYSTAVLSQTVRFTCVAYGFPAPVSVAWSASSGRNLTQLANYSSSPVKILEQNVTVNGTALLVSILELCEISADFTDEYTCSADNGVVGPPVASPTASFFLTVLKPMTEPPAVIVHPPISSTVAERSSIELTCIAYGSPVPFLSWSRQGCIEINNSTMDNLSVHSETIIINEVVMSRSTLKICNASYADSAEYRCSADNGVSGNGLAEAQFTFNVTVLLSDLSAMSSATKNPMEPSSTVTPTTNRTELLLFVIPCGVALLVAILSLLLHVMLGIYIIKFKQRPRNKADSQMEDKLSLINMEDETKLSFINMEDETKEDHQATDGQIEEPADDLLQQWDVPHFDD